MNIGEVPMDEPNKKSKSRKKNLTGDIYSSGDEAGPSLEAAARRRQQRIERRKAEAKENQRRKQTMEELEDLDDFLDDSEVWTEEEKKKYLERVKNMPKKQKIRHFKAITEDSGLSAKQVKLQYRLQLLR